MPISDDGKPRDIEICDESTNYKEFLSKSSFITLQFETDGSGTAGGFVMEYNACKLLFYCYYNPLSGMYLITNAWNKKKENVIILYKKEKKKKRKVAPILNLATFKF